jgi:hypothetical protein
MTELIVQGTLLRFTQDIVGFLDFLEALLGLLIARITIGVIFHGQPAIGFFQLRLADIAGNFQDLVIITFSHAAQSHCRIAVDSLLHLKPKLLSTIKNTACRHMVLATSGVTQC